MPNTHRGNGAAQMRDYAMKKPVAITVDGKFILPVEVESGAALGMIPFSSLDTSLQQKLTLERIKADPKYDLGSLSRELVTKDEVIANVEQLTDLGKVVITAEMNYCQEFVSGLTPTIRQLPKIKLQKLPIPPLGPWGTWKPKRLVKLYLKNTVVFCEACVDHITCSAAHYRIEHVHPTFAGRGFNVVSLEGANDTRANFAPGAKLPFVDYISGVGHGAPNLYTGVDHLLEVGAYDPLEVKGKVIHLLSCETAQELGKDVAANGAKAYSGYYGDFWISWADSVNMPPDDVDAQLFWQSDSTFDICMANGHTVEQAYNTTIAAFNVAIASAPNTVAATWLTWDRNCFRSPVSDAAYGDMRALAPSMTAVWITVPFAIRELATAVEAKVGEQEAPAPEKVAVP